MNNVWTEPDLARAEAKSTLTLHGATSKAEWIACASPEERQAFLDSLEDNTIAALPYLFDFWALEHQRPPEGDWRTWLVMGGRGAGKTRAGAEWVRSMVEGPRPADPGRARRVALVGETIEQVREVMVFGDSGLIAVSPPDRTPKWIAGRKMLQWPNGATAQVFSAHEPENLRGPQFDLAWSDELAKWKRGVDAWDMLQFALRLGDDPRQIVTTTPRNVKVVKELMKQSSTVCTHAPTIANKANLAKAFLEEVYRKYDGTRLGRQELDGELLQDNEAAFWRYSDFDGQRVRQLPDFSRIVVAVDPPVSGHSLSDECGIVVVGAVTEGPVRDWYAVVLEDATVQGYSPNQWGKRALQAVREHKADRLVAEVNQGGNLVETVLRGLEPNLSYRGVRASRGKTARAEPVAALYEQGRVRHVRGLDVLEDQMVQMTGKGFLGSGSPDRVDALVWAITDLLIDGAGRSEKPQIRSL